MGTITLEEFQVACNVFYAFSQLQHCVFFRCNCLYLYLAINIAFVDWKSSGKIYVSQHTQNRRHEEWKNNVVDAGGLDPYSGIIFFRFF